MNAEKDVKKILGRNVKKYRELRGYTQEVFMEKIGIGNSAISNIECGKSFPAPETLRKISSVLGIDYYMFFVDEKRFDENEIIKDFEKRFNIIKNNKEKLEILYGVLKILT